MQANEQIANPIIESTLKDWREQGGLTRLEGSKCKNCGETFFPKDSYVLVVFHVIYHYINFLDKGRL